MRQLVYNKIGCLPNHKKNKNITYAKRVLMLYKACYGVTYSIEEMNVYYA